MGRKPCCRKEGVNRGAWSSEEDQLLSNYIELHGEGKWRNLPQNAGLNRCGKSCRLRWMNYLRPGIKRGHISPEEDDLIIRLHRLLGNRWSLIAGRLPGRTDNEIKNYWNSVLAKKLNVDVTITPKVIVPKASRCTKMLLPFDQGEHLKNINHSSPSSTPTDTNDGLTLESSKDNDVLDMHSAFDYSDLSLTGMEDVFETSNMFENDELVPEFEMEFDNLTSLLEMGDDWTKLL